MPRLRRWRDLLPGTLAMLALAGGATAVLRYARVGTIHGRTFRLYATVASTGGLSAGSDVWLGGERVGTVRRVDFLPPTSDTTQRLLLSLDVLESVRPIIRRGAPIDVHAGGNLIGAPVVGIGFGVPAQPPVAPGDTLRSPPGPDLDDVRSQFEDASDQVAPIVANLRLLAVQLRAARGTLGALGIDGTPELSAVAGSGRRLIGMSRSGGGTIGRALHGGDAIAYSREALARVDSIRSLLTGPTTRHALGRFRRDSTLFRQIAAVRAELDTVARALVEPRGTAGRLQEDSALAQQLERSRLELAALTADLRRNPLRYLAF